jgi:hypothetical protein
LIGEGLLGIEGMFEVSGVNALDELVVVFSKFIFTAGGGFESLAEGERAAAVVLLGEAGWMKEAEECWTG